MLRQCGPHLLGRPDFSDLDRVRAVQAVWHEHCWGLTDEGVIIETTLSWDAYFGVPVPRMKQGSGMGADRRRTPSSSCEGGFMTNAAHGHH